MSISIRNNESELFEKVMLQNDLVGLTPLEKVQHIKNVCLSLGLNPLTKPIQLHKFQGKEVMYMGKDGAEQIRNLHNVSIVKLETDILNNDLYVVKAYATKPNGRQDCSTSAISIDGLKGESIGNAMKKCETQAKRRVTLSICGLGILDESEIDDLPKDKFKIKQLKTVPLKIQDGKLVETMQSRDLTQDLLDISQCNDINELQSIFTVSYKYLISINDRDSIKILIDAKDKKKNTFDNVIKESNQDINTYTEEVL